MYSVCSVVYKKVTIEVLQLPHLPITSDKITGFYRIYKIFLILDPVNHDNPVILSKKHGSYPHLHSRAQRERQTNH